MPTTYISSLKYTWSPKEAFAKEANMLEQFTSFAIYTASAVFSILLLITLIAIGKYVTSHNSWLNAFVLPTKLLNNYIYYNLMYRNSGYEAYIHNLSLT